MLLRHMIVEAEIIEKPSGCRLNPHHRHIPCKSAGKVNHEPRRPATVEFFNKIRQERTSRRCSENRRWLAKCRWIPRAEAGILLAIPLPEAANVAPFVVNRLFTLASAIEPVIVVV